MNETLNQLKQMLTSKAPEVAKAVKAMIDEYGGVTQFVEEMKKRGLPEKAKAWLADGKKFVLSQEQVQKALGDERLQKIADQLKTTPDRLATLLGEALPPLLEKLEQAREKIDAVTKAAPEGSFVAEILKKVGGFLGGSSSTASAPEKPDPDSKA